MLEKKNEPPYKLISALGAEKFKLGMEVDLMPVNKPDSLAMYFEDANGHLFRKKADDTLVYICKPNGDDYIPVGNLNIRALWEEFGEQIVTDDCKLESSWRGFPEGTYREDIWHWFEDQFGVSVGKMMYDTDGYKYYLMRRPLSIGTVPKGFIDYNEDEETFGRYGAVYYDRPLTEQEIQEYELMIAPF